MSWHALCNITGESNCIMQLSVAAQYPRIRTEWIFFSIWVCARHMPSEKRNQTNEFYYDCNFFSLLLYSQQTCKYGIISFTSMHFTQVFCVRAQQSSGRRMAARKPTIFDVLHRNNVKCVEFEFWNLIRFRFLCNSLLAAHLLGPRYRTHIQWKWK